VLTEVPHKRAKPAEEAGEKMRRFFASCTVILAVLALASATPGWAAPQEKPAYTPAEYNAYTACANDKNAQTRAKCMEDFIVKFPDSTLVPYANNVQLTTYNELKNYPKTIEYADKLLALGEKIDLGTRVQAAYIRSFNFHLVFNEKAADAAEQGRRAREAALRGVDLLGQLPQPPNMTPDLFAQQKKAPLALFHYTAGFASLQLKEYSDASTHGRLLDAGPLDRAEGPGRGAGAQLSARPTGAVSVERLRIRAGRTVERTSHAGGRDSGAPGELQDCQRCRSGSRAQEPRMAERAEGWRRNRPGHLARDVRPGVPGSVCPRL
jgi:hypothetical protein